MFAVNGLEEIAKKHSMEIRRRGDLHTRGNDGDDFVEMSIWSIRAMLADAYRLGYEAKKTAK